MMGKKEIEAYKQGFLNGSDIKANWKIQMLGYDLGKLIDIVGEYKLKGAEQPKPAFEINYPNGSRHSYKIWADGRIEGFADHAVVVNRIPELMMEAKQPEPSIPPVMKALCSIMTETEIKMGPDYGKLTAGHISMYGSGCIIDGLAARGYKIVKDTDEQWTKEEVNILKQRQTITPSTTEPIVHFDEWPFKLQTDPAKGLQVFVYGKLVYQHNK